VMAAAGITPEERLCEGGYIATIPDSWAASTEGDNGVHDLRAPDGTMWQVEIPTY